MRAVTDTVKPFLSRRKLKKSTHRHCHIKAFFFICFVTVTKYIFLETFKKEHGTAHGT